MTPLSDAVPARCRYDRDGWCTAHPGGQPYRAGVPWCHRGRMAALAVATVYERQAEACRARRDGLLSAVLWRQEAGRLDQVARRIVREAGGR